MSTERVTESFAFSGGVVDESGPYPRIKGVVICGLRSVHGYDYDPRVWEGGRAKAMYEGLDSFMGHAEGREDRTAQKLGWWENVTTGADGKPRGDYCLNPEHPYARSVLWAAKHRPGFYKMSHVADVRKVKKPDGRVVVEGMASRAHSIDLVECGGTTETLFESGRKRKGNTVACTVREYANKLGPKCSVEQLLKLRSLVKEDGMGGAPMPDAAPDAAADSTGAEDGITAAFKAAFDMIRDKLFAGEMDKKTAMKKLAAIFDGHGDAQDATDETGKGGEEEEEEDAAKEGGKKKPASIDPWEILTECEREQFKPDATDLKVLKLVHESADRLAYIRRQKGLTAATAPTGKSRQQIAEGDAKQKSGTVKESGEGGQPASGVEEARQLMANLSKDLRGGK